jgi:hypothetical protein
MGQLVPLYGSASNTYIVDRWQITRRYVGGFFIIDLVVGLCTSRTQLTHSLKPPGANP